MALIDSGGDISEARELGIAWANPAETADEQDSDGNGLVDDIFGWDFAYQDNNPYDWPEANSVFPVPYHPGIAHGAFMTDITSREVPEPPRELRVAFLRVSDGRRPVSIQSLLDALHYSATIRPALVLVALGGSWPQRTDELLDAIDLLHDSVVILAAGNNGVEIDAVTVPGALCIKINVICVASHGRGYDRGTAHTASNFGPQTIDISADGGPVMAHGRTLLTGSVSNVRAALDDAPGASCLLISPMWDATGTESALEVSSLTSLPLSVTQDGKTTMSCPAADGRSEQMELEGTSVAAARVAGGLVAFASRHPTLKGSALAAEFISRAPRDSAQIGTVRDGKVFVSKSAMPSRSSAYAPGSLLSLVGALLFPLALLRSTRRRSRNLLAIKEFDPL